MSIIYVSNNFHFSAHRLFSYVFFVLIFNLHAQEGNPSLPKDFPLHVCSGSVKNEKIGMSWKDSNGSHIKSVDRLLKSSQKKITCATNAGIYTQEFRPLGLYIENGKKLVPLNTRKNAYGNFYLEPNGVFFITNNTVQISTTEKYPKDDSEVLYATQSGPILIINKKINKIFDKSSGSRLIRNAVCTRSNSEMIIAVSKIDMNFYELADYLLKIGCVDALYLDGAISYMYPYESSNKENLFGPFIWISSR
jgi:uncharacterized protein YigE (DUF2233 family)